MATLLLVTQLDTTTRPGARVVLWPLCGILLVVSLLIRSAGIALLTGLVAWLAASWFVDRQTAWRRLKTYLPLLLIGLVVQALWMNWVATHEVLEWPLVRGYPQSYVAQLSVKDGNRPELGAATLSDIPPRVARNLSERALFLVELLTRKKLNPAWWFSPVVLGPVLLVLVGVGCSLWRGGGRLQEWYFVSYEAMYVLWPWYLEIRFFVPIAPLACLYLWRGGEALLGVAFRRPRVFGAWSTLLSLPLAVYAGAAAWTSGSRHPTLAAIFWALVVTASAWMVWSDPHRLPTPLGRLLSWSRVMVSVPGRRRLTLPTAIAAASVAILVAAGIAGQLSAGRENLTLDVTRESTYPDAEAGWWIQAHTATTAVVMARHLDVVFHHGKRKVVWFPPLSNPQQLMDGIRRHRVEFVVVISREWSYWLPPEQDCFEPLVGAYPKAFKLVHEGPRLRIFQVVARMNEATRERRGELSRLRQDRGRGDSVESARGNASMTGEENPGIGFAPSRALHW